MISVLVTLVHGLGLAVLAAVIGGFALELLILRPDASGLTVARGRLRRWTTLWLIVLLLVAPADLVVRALAMSQGSAGPAPTLPEILTGTHFGTVWIVRVIVLGLAVLLSITRPIGLRILGALLVLGAALTTTLTGHAAEWGDLTVSVAVDWAHVVAASAWTGGLIGLALLVRGQASGWAPETLGRVARRFSRLAGACLLTVVVTGSYNAWSQLGTLSPLWTTPYGRWLAVKLLLVVGLVWLGGLNRYVVVPRLAPVQTARGLGARVFRISRLVFLGPRRRVWEAPARFSTYLAREAVLVLAVFACTAALGEATPGRHAVLQRKASSHALIKSPRPVRGGAPVTPPPGDVVQGRTVFVKLRCFECHTVAGERFPAARQPGPDLTDVGRNPSGYLLESIVNPNAMIVDGPGYADGQGRSTMPDDRDRLTVGELIDLVAYLKGLTVAPLSAPGRPRSP
jgi:putative copper export protein